MYLFYFFFITMATGATIAYCCQGVNNADEHATKFEDTLMGHGIH